MNTHMKCLVVLVFDPPSAIHRSPCLENERVLCIRRVQDDGTRVILCMVSRELGVTDHKMDLNSKR